MANFFNMLRPQAKLESFVLPASLTFELENKSVTINRWQGAAQSAIGATNIIASGASVAGCHFSHSFLACPAIFMNGSIALKQRYAFTNIVAYVISDERFVAHNSEILQEYYAGEPLFVTLKVLRALVRRHPQLVLRYQRAITLIWSVQRTFELAYLQQPLKRKLANKINLLSLVNDADFMIKSSDKHETCGVSFAMERGFVESGTVAFVAAQLAYSLGATQIDLYGIDLVNSDQPRFYESNTNQAPCKLAPAVETRIVPSFKLLVDSYRKKGVAVVNHSPLSKELF